MPHSTLMVATMMDHNLEPLSPDSPLAQVSRFFATYNLVVAPVVDSDGLERGLVESRSEAENWIGLGQVMVNGRVATRPGCFVNDTADITLLTRERYVSRAGLKLASVADSFRLDFQGKTVLDIGSSTGGFTDFALRHGARRVYAVDVGTNQLHHRLRDDRRIILHEKTDIRDFELDCPPDIIVGDVSFISLRDILPHVAKRLMGSTTVLVAMVKLWKKASLWIGFCVEM